MVTKKVKTNHPYYRVLSGTSMPFPHIHEAVSEQLLLLIFKARRLYLDPEYRPWFDEQHRILSALRANTKLQSILEKNRENYSISETDNPLSKDLYAAFQVMCHLYNGFDNRLVSLKTWGDMNREPTAKFVGQNSGGWKTPEMEEFVRNDLFNILTDCKAHCSPLPALVRQGYCHQDLSVAHSCTKELLEQLNRYHQIDESTILARTLGLAINNCYHSETEIPEWLSPFENEYKSPWNCEKPDTNDVSKLRKQLLTIGRTEFVDKMFSLANKNATKIIYDGYVKLYALEIYEWLNKLVQYFKGNDFIRYTWKFTTIISDESDTIENTTAWEKDYCQITIQRDELLKLIYTNTLQDAAMNLADCLQQAYTEPLKMEINYPGINIDAKERKIRKSIEFRSELNNFTNIMKQLEIFEKWYNANKILLVSNKKIRTEKIDVNIRLAGLKGYDLNEGIPDGQGRRIKDGVNELVKADGSLQLPQDISDTSLNRYRQAVQHIIKDEIDTLLIAQREKNKINPYSEDRYSIRPLWGKCLVEQ